MKPHLVGKAEPVGDFVCPWCATRKQTRAQLDDHWRASAECWRNRNVSNPLPTKYGQAGSLPLVPGQDTLTRIRMADCTHEQVVTLYADDGAGGFTSEVIGWQCLACYATGLPADAD